MKTYNVCHCSLYLDSLIHTWTASSSLQISSRVPPKTEYCFKYLSLTLLQKKSDKMKYKKAIFSDFSSRSGAGPPGAGS